jgi:hypothetical protein
MGIGQNFVKSFDDFHSTGIELDKAADATAQAALEQEDEEDEEGKEKTDAVTLDGIGEAVTDMIAKLNTMRKNEGDEKATKVISGIVSDLMKVEDKIDSMSLTNEEEEEGSGDGGDE